MATLLIQLDALGGGSLTRILRDYGHRLQTVHLDSGDALPGDLDDIGAVVLCGHMASAAAPDGLSQLLAEAHASELPTIGLGDGAAVLATALGGASGESPAAGWHEVKATADGREEAGRRRCVWHRRAPQGRPTAMDVRWRWCRRVSRRTSHLRVPASVRTRSRRGAGGAFRGGCIGDRCRDRRATARGRAPRPSHLRELRALRRSDRSNQPGTGQGPALLVERDGGPMDRRRRGPPASSTTVRGDRSIRRPATERPTTQRLTASALAGVPAVSTTGT